MTPDLKRSLKSHALSFGSFTRSGELKTVQVWLTVNDGRIEFLTDGQSFKVRRVRHNPRVICSVGSASAPPLNGTAEVIVDENEMARTYRAYWKTHPIGMIFLGLILKRRIKSGRQVLIRVKVDDPNPLAGVTDPSL